MSAHFNQTKRPWCISFYHLSAKKNKSRRIFFVTLFVLSLLNFVLLHYLGVDLTNLSIWLFVFVFHVMDFKKESWKRRRISFYLLLLQPLLLLQSGFLSLLCSCPLFISLPHPHCFDCVINTLYVCLLLLLLPSFPSCSPLKMSHLFIFYLKHGSGDHSSVCVYMWVSVCVCLSVSVIICALKEKAEGCFLLLLLFFNSTYINTCKGRSK